ncbi:MAG TPA: guanitoxin biosynthesis L-enduracididine beta-hydroxylase GntD [Thermoanaerobaculia bacterium]|jgi:Fe(II)/alpha-ketoglutarate-dependent arginine beta-hydroxylase|nr:guanitoxin biosynthesis L-enduracididine beta-hydroxylase GntD [Thermoanaerobaculia bacterium]
MARISLTQEEIAAIGQIVGELAAAYDSAEDPSFLMTAALTGHELPRRLRGELYDFKLTEPSSSLLVVSGLPIDDAKIGPTPEHWREPARGRVLEEEIFLVLLTSLLGECFGWSTQQGGRIIHDIIPIKGHEGEQISSGSEQPIWWHTEDAFHPLRGDYVGMLCLRNSDRVPTTFASLERLGLDAEDLRLLFEPNYVIQPDESHRQKNAAAPSPQNGGDAPAYQRIEEMMAAPPKIAVLHGDPRSPYIRIDPYFMSPVTDNPRAQRALEALIEAIDQRLQEVVLEPGDVYLIDNFKAVHGRRPFKARYDGTDRWLKRINVTRDMRKSRAERPGAADRVIL